MFVKGKRLCLGWFLVLAYLISGMVGKSYLEYAWQGTWRVHEATAVVLTTALVAYLFLRWHQEVDIRQLPRSYRTARSALFAFLGCVIATGLMQEPAAINIVTSLTYVGMVLVLGIYPQLYFRKIRPERLIDILCLLISLGTLACIIAVLTGSTFALAAGNRLNGIYNSSITSARMFNLGCLLLLWRIVRCRRHRKLAVAMFTLTLIGLVLTKTRTNIACVIVTSGIFLAYVLSHKGRGIEAFIIILALVSGLVLVLLPGVVDRYQDEVSDIRTFIRLDKTPEEIASNRLPYWNEGLKDIDFGNPLGRGYLAAFGGGSGGFQESGYDRESNRHNMFFSCAQSYGIIGLCLFCSFICITLYRFVVGGTPLAALGLTVLVYTLITGITGNCLLSFGDPVDRFAWLLLGICSSCQHSGNLNAERAHNQKGRLGFGTSASKFP